MVDLHMAQLMPLPLTVSCFSKIQIGFTFLVPAHLGSPGKRDVKRVCVGVCCVSFVGFGFFSVPSQEIGWKERFRNDLFSFDWGVKRAQYSTLLHTRPRYSISPASIYYKRSNHRCGILYGRYAANMDTYY